MKEVGNMTNIKPWHVKERQNSHQCKSPEENTSESDEMNFLPQYRTQRVIQHIQESWQPLVM
jgi:hypothetical protein